MRLSKYIKLGRAGFSHHFILPVIAVLAVGAIGVVMVRLSSAATGYTTYNTNCANTVISYKSAKPYNRGTCVRNVQARLIAKGYLPNGSNDGYYGPATYSAVKKFQAANKLPQNGLGPVTYNALNSSWSNRSSSSSSSSTSSKLPPSAFQTSKYCIANGYAWHAPVSNTPGFCTAK